MKRLNIRWQLTLWYAGVLAVVLAFFSAVVYLVMRHQLMRRIDQGLVEELADVRYEIERAKDAKGLHEWLDRRFARHEGFDFQITRPQGERFFINNRFADRFLPVPEHLLASGSPVHRNVLLNAGRWRVIGVQVQGPDGPLAVQVARSLASFEQESGALLSTFLLTGPVTVLAAIAGGYVLARRALAPVQNMTRTANQITADRLDQRINVENPDDELGGLAQTLNRMIERLERSFTEMQRFTADAAHELRTPLAVMRSEAEVALRTTRSTDEYGRVLENLLEETNHLAHLADQLLFLCRQDAGLQSAKREVVAVNALLKEVVANMQLVAEAKGVSLSLNGEPRSQVLADPGHLRRLFYNLLDNAIKYTETGGQVAVTTTAGNGALTVEVQDTGIGIPPEHLPRIFDRFYRVDAARIEANGAGLGLSLCRSIVKRLGGSITAKSEHGKGTKLVVMIPATGGG